MLPVETIVPKLFPTPAILLPAVKIPTSVPAGSFVGVIVVIPSVTFLVMLLVH